MKNHYLALGIVALITGALGFFGGMQYQKSQTRFPGSRGQFQAPEGQFRPEGFPSGENRGSRNGMSPVSGEILSLDGQTITVQTPDGNKLVVYSENTTVNQTTQGSVADLQPGDQIMVLGTADTQGTITAQTISSGGGFPGMPRGEAPEKQEE